MKAALNPPVEITLFFDRGVASLAAVTATSLLAHASPDRDYILHAFTVGMDADARGRLEALSAPRFAIRAHDLRDSLAAANLREIGDNIAFQRLLLSELLPSSPRVVYLDVDLVVLHDIARLFDTELAGAPIAACVDFHMRRHLLRNDRMPANIYDGTFRDYLTNALHIKDAAQTRYFNSGVLLFDLDTFRARRSSEKARVIVDGYPGKFLNRDQCVFNQLFAEEMKELDARWNALVPVSRFRLRAAKDADSELIRSFFTSPAINRGGITHGREPAYGGRMCLRRRADWRCSPISSGQRTRNFPARSFHCWWRHFRCWSRYRARSSCALRSATYATPASQRNLNR